MSEVIYYVFWFVVAVVVVLYIIYVVADILALPHPHYHTPSRRIKIRHSPDDPFKRPASCNKWFFKCDFPYGPTRDLCFRCREREHFMGIGYGTEDGCQ